MIKEITSIKNPLIKETLEIKRDKKSNYFIIETNHLLQMALKSNLLVRVFTIKKLDIDEDIEQIIVNDAIIKKLSSLMTESGIIGVCKKKKEYVEDCNLLIYLDYIQDPGNLGTILRSGLAFGIKNFLISKNSVSIYNLKTIMASQGAIFNINFKYISDIKQLNTLKNEYKFIGFSLTDDSENFNNFKFYKQYKYVLIFGNEGNGISKKVLDLCDKKLILPINNIDSLNVAICFSIVAYEITNK